MRSSETLKGLDKIYCIDRMPIGQFLHKGRCAIVLPDQLPITLAKDDWTPAKTPVGENIARGAAYTARLRLQLSALAERDTVVVRLNGNAMGDVVPAGVISTEPGPA